MSPSSGNPPYVVSAIFQRKQYITDGLYSLEIIYPNAAGVCPLPTVTTPNNEGLVDMILATNQATIMGTVGAGQCRLIRAIIRDVATSVIVSSSYAYIDNT